MTKKEFNRLAHEMAAEMAGIDIASGCVRVRVKDSSARWYDVRDCDEASRADVERAVRYLDAAGLVRRVRGHPEVLRIKLATEGCES